MIVFFGPAGAGKSVQGKMLAARHEWRWLSTGQLLRDTKDPELQQYLKTGKLVSDEQVNKLMGDALEDEKDMSHIVLDGYPRKMSQAEWLLKNQPLHEKLIDIVIVLEVPRSEIIRRMMLRGRADDTEQAIEERLQIYRREMYPVLSYLTEYGVHVAHIDGTGTVGNVHDRIEAELVACKIA